MVPCFPKSCPVWERSDRKPSSSNQKNHWWIRSELHRCFSMWRGLHLIESSVVIWAQQRSLIDVIWTLGFEASTVNNRWMDWMSSKCPVPDSDRHFLNGQSNSCSPCLASNRHLNAFLLKLCQSASALSLWRVWLVALTSNSPVQRSLPH